jgi:fatty acid desaturase
MTDDPQRDRNTIAIAFTGTAVAGLTAAMYPVLIPALAMALAAFMAIAVLLKL